MTKPETFDPNHSDPTLDATVRLPVGEPADPYSTQRLDLPKHRDRENTMKLPVGAPEADGQQTQKLVLPEVDEPPVRVQKVDGPAEAAGRTSKLPVHPEPSKSFGWKLPLALCGLVGLGVTIYLNYSPGPAKPLPPPALATAPEDSVPPGAQEYFEKAKAGDTDAMRMLGAMYCNGLNVPKNREKGISWYRKAAEKGSEAARAELSNLEGGR